MQVIDLAQSVWTCGYYSWCFKFLFFSLIFLVSHVFQLFLLFPACFIYFWTREFHLLPARFFLQVSWYFFMIVRRYAILVYNHAYFSIFLKPLMIQQAHFMYTWWYHRSLFYKGFMFLLTSDTSKTYQYFFIFNATFMLLTLVFILSLWLI